MTEAFLGPLQRWMMHAGVLLMVGVATWSMIVRPAAISALAASGIGASAETRFRQLSGRVIRFGRGTTALLVPVWALGLVVQVLGFRDPFVPLRDDVFFLLGQTFWGTVWVAQGSVLLLLSLRVGRLQLSRRPRPWSSVVGLLVVALPVTLALSSHAMSESGIHRIIAVSADASHAVAAGAWMGSLALILLVRDRSEEAGSILAAQLRAFSPVALCAVPVLVVMGGTLSIYHLSSVEDLWSAPYGRILLGKVLLAGVVLLLGFLNWKRGLPILDASEGRRTVRRRAAWEVAAAGIVLAFTAVLTTTPSP